MQKVRLTTMISKRILLTLAVVFFNQISGDDDCGDDLDLSLSYWFNFSGSVISLLWQLKTQTECPVLYHLLIRDFELGIIRDDYLEETSALLEGISPCVLYYFELKAVNQAVPTMEGPPITMGITFSQRVQKVPTIGSVDSQVTSINMTWILDGDANRCPLIRLYIDGGDYFNLSIPLQDLTDRSIVPVEITSLKPSSMYFFKVYVENNAGMSPAAQIAVQTLDSTDQLN